MESLLSHQTCTDMDTREMSLMILVQYMAFGYFLMNATTVFYQITTEQ